MTSTMAPDQSDSAADTWSIVSGCLEKFVQAWDSGGPAPELAACLPAGPPPVRRLALIELIKLDLDYRVQRRLDRPLETYIELFPELAAGGLPCDLLYEDFHLRRQNGQAVDADDYYRRFPERARELAKLLGGTADKHTTSVLAGRIPVTFRPGEHVDDFDLLALLGEGRFAQVFLARQRSMQRLVALKVSRQRGAEAQTLAQLDHPHIVRVYDQRALQQHDVLLVYMPYLPGGTLQEVLGHVRALPPKTLSGRTLLAAVDAALERRGELPPATSRAREQCAARSWPATVCALGAKLARALDYAHQHHVLHRDIKPANILLTAEAEPLIADFNVGCCSKLDGAGPAALFGGSLAYMAPEHLEAFNPDHGREPDSLDGRADVFSLAVTLWEMRTGSRPFPMEKLGPDWLSTLAELTRQRQAGPSIETMVAFADEDVPGLRETLLRCLEPDPGQRPPDAGAMARELELCLRPATRELVRPKPGGWRGFVRRHPLLAAYPAGLIPNILAAVFNIEYDRREIVWHWGTEAEHAFDNIMAVVNGVFFPLGMFIWALVMLRVARGVRRLERGEAVSADELAALRQEALRLGTRAAGVCVGCWMVAGLVWPVALRLLAGPPPGMEAYVYFVLSLAVCGLMVASYPYFLLTYMSVHALYPALLGRVAPVAADGPALRRVERALPRYRAIAAAVPFVFVLFLAIRRSDAANEITFAALSLTGLAGVALAYLLEGRIRADLAALLRVPGVEDRSITWHTVGR